MNNTFILFLSSLFITFFIYGEKPFGLDSNEFKQKSTLNEKRREDMQSYDSLNSPYKKKDYLKVESKDDIDKKKITKQRIFKEFVRIEIMDLKGPPSVYEIMQKRQEKLDDLNLLIQSRKVEGKKLNLLEKMSMNLSLEPEPTQEEINKRFKKRIKSLRQKLKKRQIYLRKELSLKDK